MAVLVIYHAHLDKASKSFLQRFMKKDLSVMKAVVVSFQMAPAVSKFMAMYES